MQGYFDLRFMPLPPGMSSASYQVTFEPIDALYIHTASVGPYRNGSPTPSGSMPTLPVLAPGMAQPLNVQIGDSTSSGYSDAVATEAQQSALPPSGLWSGRLSQVGQTDWFLFPVRGGRTSTVVTQALNE